MAEALSGSTQKVQNALAALGIAVEIVEFPESTRTSAEAATAIGCGVEQIAKTLIFKTKQTGRPVIVIASGINRVSEKKVGALLGEPIEKADAAFVREHTGFAIGGVPPVGHSQKLDIVIDEDLLRYETIWAAAGTPNSVFRLTPADLLKMTEASAVDVKA